MIGVSRVEQKKKGKEGIVEVFRIGTFGGLLASFGNCCSLRERGRGALVGECLVHLSFGQVGKKELRKFLF